MHYYAVRTTCVICGLAVVMSELIVHMQHHHPGLPQHTHQDWPDRTPARESLRVTTTSTSADVTFDVSGLLRNLKL